MPKEHSSGVKGQAGGDKQSEMSTTFHVKNGELALAENQFPSKI